MPGSQVSTGWESLSKGLKGFIGHFVSQSKSLNMYGRTGFDSAGLTAAKIATKNDRYQWNSL